MRTTSGVPRARHISWGAAVEGDRGSAAEAGGGGGAALERAAVELRQGQGREQGQEEGRLCRGRGFRGWGGGSRRLIASTQEQQPSQSN